MSRDAALEYLYGLQMFGVKLGLETIQRLLAAAGSPQQQYPVVHVAGTNGKGSVCAFLASIFRQAGYRVGVYTSPHLHCFSERIVVDGSPISLPEIRALVEELRGLAEPLEATFFELTTALALLHFARCQVDLAIVEVGMGGRLDATNAVTPAVSVVTPVSWDHSAFLGDCLGQIAGEKAGIIKPGVPVVLGPQEPEALARLLEAAQCCQSPAFVAQRDFQCRSIQGGEVAVVTPRRASFGAAARVAGGHVWPRLRPGLLGAHQHDNLAVALMATECLIQQGFCVADCQVKDAVGATCWPGRLEWWPVSSNRPTWCGAARLLLDGAHNPAGMAALANYLAAEGIERIHWVAGFKQDKDVPSLLRLLQPFCVTLHTVAPPIEMAWDPRQVAELAKQLGFSSRSYESTAAALRAAVSDAMRATEATCHGSDVVVVAGSLFLVAAAREVLIDDEDSVA
ncbi:MAG: bifunctional folylpolyglutamate synthase/dihydrofolate synthase [Desulfuromonadaceae bacterium]|nr:bifunctional folylpolyglutamate synthase/dihydrofolate synthase [Desulfuromonadaceae bacterium]